MANATEFKKNSSNNKKVVYAITAAVTFIGMALCYYMGYKDGTECVEKAVNKSIASMIGAVCDMVETGEMEISRF